MSDLGHEDLTGRAFSGLLAAEARLRKEAEDTVEALRADLEEERTYRDRAEVLLGGVRDLIRLWEARAEYPEDSQQSMKCIQALVSPGADRGPSAPELLLAAVRKEVGLWNSYADEPEDSQKSMCRIAALFEAGAKSRDPMHPTGRCSCGGEGKCDWCKANPDPYQDEPPPDPEGVLEALQSTQADIERCLTAGEKLDEVREVIDHYNDPGNETLGSLTALQAISSLVADWGPSYTRQALDGTKAALKAEMLRCQVAEAKLNVLEAAIESTTVGEWRDMTGYKRLHALLTAPTTGGDHG